MATRTKTGRSKADRLARLASKQPQRDRYDIVLDPEPVEALNQARGRLETADLFGRDVAEAQAAVEAAEAAAADAVETLHLLGLSRSVYERLQTLFPPTEKQKADKETYDLDRFLPALIAATVVEDPEEARMLTVADLDGYDETTILPGRLLSAAEVTETIAPWNQAEVGVLWNKAVGVCTQVRNPSLPFGSGRTRG